MSSVGLLRRTLPPSWGPHLMTQSPPLAPRQGHHTAGGRLSIYGFREDTDMQPFSATCLGQAQGACRL